MKKEHFIIMTALVYLCFGAQCISQQRASLEVALQKALDESIQDSEAVGVSAAVILPDGRLWTGASGISHKDTPLTADMLLDIGSIEKNFQAALCLSLAEDGLLSLDDPLEKWVFPYAYIDGTVPLRQLLNMTSGFDKIVDDANSPWSIGYKNIEFEKIWTWEDIHRSFVSTPNFKPGTKTEYSTTNYLLLTQVIEAVTQKPQIEVFEDRILKPLRLNHTLVRFFEPIPDTLSIAHGWCDIDPDDDPEDITLEYSLNWLASFSPMLVYSTAEDMVRWIDELYHKKTVLSEDMLQAMLSFSGPVQNETMMNGYGLGVVDINLGAILPRWEDVRTVGHLGSQFGYSAFAVYFPDLETSVAILFNRGCDAATNRALGTVADAFFEVLFTHLDVKESVRKDGISDMRKELEKSPDDVHLMYRLARKYQETNEDYDASLLYKTILEADPDDHFGHKTEALYWNASYDGVIHRKPEALIAFIAEHPDYKDIRDAYRWLAKTYQRRNELDKAVQVYHDALQIFNQDPEFYNDYAWWVYENEVKDEYKTALTYTREAVKIKPEACHIWDTLAWLYLVTGDYNKAVETSEKALSLAPEDLRPDYEQSLNRIRKGK